MTLRTSLLISSLVFSFGCAVEDADELEFRTSGTGGGAGTGIVFNTNVFDGELSEMLQPMGTDHQGHALDAVELADSTPIEYFEIEDDGELVAYDFNGADYRGAEVIESSWDFEGYTTWMTPLQLAERVVIDGVPHFRFQKGVNYGSTCEDSENETVYARLLPGFTLDEATGEVEELANNTYVACTNGATGKAAAWGYYDLAQDLEDYAPFELAIRVIRADYCYDGVSYTHAGVGIGIEDAWDIATPGGDDLEAVWGPDGLLCRGDGRANPIPTSCDSVSIPTCAPGTSLSTYPGALFLTRTPGPGPVYL